MFRSIPAIAIASLLALADAHAFTRGLAGAAAHPLMSLAAGRDAARQEALSHAAAWRAFRAQHGPWHALWNERSGTPHRAFGPGIPLDGYRDEPEAVDRAVRGFIARHADLLAGARTLATVQVARAGRVWYARYRETVRGVPVLFQDWEFRVDAGGRLMAFGVDAYPIAEDVETTPSLAPAAARAAAAAGLEREPGHARIEGGERLWLLPVPDEGGIELRLVAEVHVHTEDPVARWIVLVDARTGEVRWRHDQVRTAITGTVRGQVHLDLPTDPLVLRPFPRERVDAGPNTAATHPHGGFYSVAAAGTITVSTQLFGLFCDVNRRDGVTDASFSTSANDGDVVSVQWMAPSHDAERDGFYHTTRVHDWVKALDPTFTGNDYPMACNVNINSTCNAYWDGSSINFFRAGDGCPNTATMPDVVYHEYGHGVNDNQYLQAGAPFGMLNGALHEGMADMLAALVQDTPDIGKGFFGPGSVLRTLDNTQRWPADASADPHLSGLILGGAFWDLRVTLGLATASRLAHFARYGIPDDGDDGVAMNEYFVEVLVADDDNGDLSDGTPHDDAIAGAFNAHGIGTGFWIQLFHAPLADQPSFGPYPVTARVTYDAVVPVGGLGGPPQLHWSTDGVSYSAVPMAPTGTPDEFSASIPATIAAIVRYYIRATDTEGGENTSPPVAPERRVHRFIAGPASPVLLHDMESDHGWTVGAPGDDATTGIWLWAVPIGTDFGGIPVQPYYDHTDPGTACFVTGNAPFGQPPGTNDVDNGRTSVTTSTFDAVPGGIVNPILDYWRWYTNDQGAAPGSDDWRTLISNDDGATWTVVENTRSSDASWQRVTFFVSDYVNPTATMRMRFVASDSADGSLVEAAVDDFRLLGFPAPTAVGDDVASVGTELSIGPSPFRSSARIRFGLAADGHVRLAVYDVRGARMRVLLDRSLAAGSHQLAWDGRDARGRAVPAGLYFIRLESAGLDRIRSIVRLRY